MANRTIELRVSAAADASMRTVFKSFETSAKQAQESVRRELGKTPAAAKKSADGVSKEYGAMWGDYSKNAFLTTQLEQRESDKQVKIAERAAREKARIRKRETDEVLSTMRRVGTESARSVGHIAREAGRIGGEIMSGMGVDLSVGGQVRNAVKTNRTVIDTVNSGFIAKGQTAGQADVANTQKVVESAGDSSKIAYGDMANALKTYVERTGELKEGEDMLASMGDIAQATGSRVEDVAAAAGSMSKAMGDVPNKAQKVQELLRSIAFQGAAGSVEIRQLAANMPKITSQAFLFGGKGGLSREAAIGQLGALAQFSVVGGAANASQATTSVAAFTDILQKTKGKKAAQIKAEYGIDFARERDSRGEAISYKSPQQIIKEVLASTGGSPEALSKIFGNVRGAKPALGLAQVFQDAGGGKAGEAAIDEIFRTYAKGMSEEQVKGAADLAKNSPEAKAEEFNNNLQKIATKLVSDVLPAFDRLTPKLTEFLSAFEKVIAWAANNPGSAITAAIVGSIAKAAVGEAAGAALQAGMKSIVNSSESFAGKMGQAGAAVAGVASAIVIAADLISSANKANADADTKKAIRGIEQLQAIAAGDSSNTSFGSEEEKQAAIAAKQSQLYDLQNAKKSADNYSAFKDIGLSSLAVLGGGIGMELDKDRANGQTQARRDANDPQLSQQIAALTTSIAALNKRPVEAKVTVNVNGTDGRLGKVE